MAIDTGYFFDGTCGEVPDVEVAAAGGEVDLWGGRGGGERGRAKRCVFEVEACDKGVGGVWGGRVRVQVVEVEGGRGAGGEEEGEGRVDGEGGYGGGLGGFDIFHALDGDGVGAELDALVREGLGRACQCLRAAEEFG